MRYRSGWLAYLLVLALSMAVRAPAASSGGLPRSRQVATAPSAVPVVGRTRGGTSWTALDHQLLAPEVLQRHLSAHPRVLWIGGARPHGGLPYEDRRQFSTLGRHLLVVAGPAVLPHVPHLLGLLALDGAAHAVHHHEALHQVTTVLSWGSGIATVVYLLHHLHHLAHPLRDVSALIDSQPPGPQQPVLLLTSPGQLERLRRSLQQPESADRSP